MSLKLLSLLSSPYWYQERRFDISICSFLKNVVCFIGGHFCDYHSGVMLHASSLMRFAYGSNSTGYVLPLQWRHNERDGVSNHEPHGRLIKRLFRRRSRKASKLRVTGFCEGNSPVTGGFPAQKFSDVKNVSIWWRHNVMDYYISIHPYHLRLRKHWGRSCSNASERSLKNMGEYLRYPFQDNCNVIKLTLQNHEYM